MGPDKRVIVELRKLGSDTTKPHPIDFYLYFENEVSANRAGAELELRGFSCEIQRSIGDSNWLCLARKDIIPQENTLLSIRVLLEEIARKHLGKYDGWETMILS